MAVPSTGYQIAVTKSAANLLRIFSANERLAIGAIVLLHLALVIPLAAFLNIWTDEAYTLESTGGGIIHAVRRALDFESQPPLYFIVLALWRTLDDSLFFARFFSILCTALTVALAAGLARRYLPAVHPWLVAAVVAFNPLTVYAAVEARFYAMVLLLSALLLLFFYDGYVAAGPSPSARRRYIVTAIVALYTHYFLGFLLAAGGVTLLLIRRYSVLLKYVLGMTVVAILFVPLAVITLQQLGNVEAAGTRPQPLIAGARLVWNASWDHLLPVSEDSPLRVVAAWMSRLGLPLVLVAALARRRWPTSSLLVLLFLACAVGGFFLFIAIYLGPDFMRPNHTTTLYLPVLLAALAVLQYYGGVRAAAGGALISLVFAGAYLVQAYSPLAKQGDWIRVAHYLERQETGSEPILVFWGELMIGVGYHYRGRNQLVPVPLRSMNPDRYEFKDMVLHTEDDILSALEGRLAAGQRFWLVTAGNSKTIRGVDVRSDILEEFIASRCLVLRDEWFFKSRVRLLELRLDAEGNR